MDKLLNTYNKYLEISNSDTFDFEKFNQYAIVHHSTSIEGSTLTLQETILLLDERLTPSNKPLEHTLMAIDHLEALQYTIELAKSKKPLTIANIQNISALILKNTGTKVSAMAGDWDECKGEFRKTIVRARNRTFIDYKKVPERVKTLIDFINSKIGDLTDFISINELAFDSHFQMVSIHPFSDGNGRISRLLMNYIQYYHQIPLTIIDKEDKTKYFEALEETRENEDIEVFRKFMFKQTEKFLKSRIKELSKKQKSKNIGGMSFLF